MNYFNIVGIHRSGTFYLSELIKENFNIFQHNKYKNREISFGKHQIDQKEVFLPTFIIYKPIYHWIESVAIRKPGFGSMIIKNLNYDESRFIKTNSTVTIGRANLDLNKLVNIYRQFYENWVLNEYENNKLYTFVINYTHLINNDSRLKTLNKINEHFSFLKYDEYVNIDWGDVTFSSETFRRKETYQKNVYYYYNNKPKGSFLSEEEINVIDEIIDPTFKSLIGINTNSIV